MENSLVEFVNSISKIIISIITLVGSGLIALLTAFFVNLYNQSQAIKRELKVKLFDQKSKIYYDIIKELSEAISEEKSAEEILKIMSNFDYAILLHAGNKLITQWNLIKNNLSNSREDAIKTITSFFYTLRLDLGHKDKISVLNLKEFTVFLRKHKSKN